MEALFMKKGYLYILLTTLLFSTMEISLKTISDQFNPVQLTFLRFLTGALILIPFAQKN
ncbi:MAG: EamA family transporter [Bacillota bacterium]|nr:EamA family transporter [Bacillota bacterium]